MLIYDSGKYILEYIYSLYNSIFNSGKYLYNLLFYNDYKYECLNDKNKCLNDKNNPSTPKSIFNPDNTCGISIGTQYETMSESPSHMDREHIFGGVNVPTNNCNYITRVNSNGQIETIPITFSNLSNSWKCSVCSNFNSLSINICNDCLIDPSAIPFLHEVINEIPNRIDLNSSPNTLNLDIKVSSPATVLIREILDELIDDIVEENKKSIVKDDSSSLLSDWECL